MHVGVLNQPMLVTVERHPLGKHIVGIREPCAMYRLSPVGELDAVLTQKLAALGVVGDDGLVGVDQIAVGTPTILTRRAADVEETKRVIHPVVSLADNREQQLPRS